MLRFKLTMFSSPWRYFSFSVRTPPSHRVYLLQNPSVLSSFRGIASTESVNQDSFTVSYLINSCGLSLKSALSSARRIHLKTPDEPNLVLSLLKEQGFSETQISELIRRDPKLLLVDPQDDLLPKLQFFISKGFTTSDIVKISSSSAFLSGSSLLDKIVPSFNMWRDFLQSDEKTVATLRRCLFISCSEKNLEPRISALRDIGLSESTVVKLFHFCPGITCMKLDHIKSIVERAREMGIDPSNSRFIDAFGAIVGLSKSKWQRKLDVYKMWGWTDEEVLAAFRKQPSIMRTSEEKIMVAMDLLVKKLGWESKYIAKYPVLVALSVKKRLVPRASVLQFLISKGLINKDLQDARVFTLTDTQFLERFVNCYAEAPELLKLYTEKLALSR